jgi:hypothetical protein
VPAGAEWSCRGGSSGGRPTAYPTPGRTPPEPVTENLSARWTSYGHDATTTGTLALHHSPFQRQLRNGDGGGATAPYRPYKKAESLDSKEVSPPCVRESSFQVSTIIVTGPSFTKLTRIMAPKRPVATSAPADRNWATTRSTRVLATSGAAALIKEGRRPLLVSA